MKWENATWAGWGDLPLDEIRRRIRGTGTDELPAPPGKPPVRIGDVLKRMRERGELPRAECK